MDENSHFEFDPLAPPLATSAVEFCRKMEVNEKFYGVLIVTGETILLIVLSHIFHLFLHRLGQPSAVSQMLAGVLVGKSVLGRIMAFFHINGPGGDEDHLSSMASVGRMLFMFLIGLELDFPFLRSNLRRAAAISYSGASICSAVAICSTPLVYNLTSSGGSKALFALTLALILSNTASPLVIRVATELKLTMTESGRLLVAAALVNDMSCLLFIAFISVLIPTGSKETGSTIVNKMLSIFMSLCLITIIASAVRLGVRLLDRRSEQRRNTRDIEVVGILIAMIVLSTASELLGYSSSMTSFLLGALFPRSGPTTRTTMGSLSYYVNHLVLPVYFGHAGFQTDLAELRHRPVALAVSSLVFLSIAGKVGGSVLGARLLKISFKDGVVFGLLLNVKGHVDLITISLANKYRIWSKRTYNVLLITVLLSNMLVGPAAAFFVRRERKAQRHRSMGLEWLTLDSELRLLAGVHRPQDAPTILNLLEISGGSNVRSPLAAYLLHLRQLTGRLTTAMLYHQRVDGHEIDPAGDEIHRAADTFADQTGIAVRQITAVSAHETMHRDVCNAAQDVRASLIILPFHRRQRIDGRMAAGDDGIRAINRRTLRYAPCTVGILVDRGLSCKELHQVAAIFFGGPDDRDAVAYGARLAVHPSVSVTVIRFVEAGGRSLAGLAPAVKEEEVALAVGEAAEADEEFMADVYQRFVVSGLVAYDERAVGGAVETVEALRAMEGVYSLYVVGRGRRRGAAARLTAGMEEWEECPELGSIGDLLASSDFMRKGTVLVLQQHRLVTGGSGGGRLEFEVEEEERLIRLRK
ncbi:Cation/H(+) antiporter 15 [Apostasia shenzhenica]|uniref:Cation/H(+) antiporter 15 n=1 Tax=Apostasia shenzhenica TaxID=1088818 RepID=A0A2H9ZS87_9ASPA|nr:Cation/H(+) antiporter 15 [Apostasia shenzhenica]